MNRLALAIETVEASDLADKDLVLEVLRDSAPRTIDYVFSPMDKGWLIGKDVLDDCPGDSGDALRSLSQVLVA